MSWDVQNPETPREELNPAPWCQKWYACYDILGLHGFRTLWRLGVLKLEEGWQAGAESEPHVISRVYPSVIVCHGLAPTSQNPDCSAG